MKVIKYKLKKSNVYEITLSDNKKYDLYDDIILKYELLLNKELTSSKLEEILNENNKIESYYIALKYLKSKMRTEKEIRTKLKDYSVSSINYTIDRLRKENYINDSIYIKAYINDQINLKLVGYNKINMDLIKMGFPTSEIKNILDNISEDVWLDKIKKYIDKKISSNHSFSGNVLKQKLIQDLISKGFSQELINDVLNNYSFQDDKKIYEKEYNKAKNKLSRKYNGEELNYKIKEYMYKKGFKKDSID